jgi:PAS domain S-box-containing protein
MNKQFSIDGQANPFNADLEELFENAPVGLHVMAADGTILWVNKAVLDLLGYSRDEYEGRHISEFHAGPGAMDDILARAKRSEKPQRYSARLRAKDGSIKHVQIASNGQFHDGELVLTRCFVIDVPDSKQAAQAAAHLAAIVTSSNDAIISKTLDGTITSWNAAAERMFGYAAEEVVGQSILILIPSDRRHEEEEILTRLRAGERIEHYETVRRTKDGRNLDVSLTISPIKDADGRITGASKIARDITERRREERTREHLIKELHHRIKNTLANVQALAQHTLRRSTSPAAFVASFSARIQALARAHSLLTDEGWQSIDLKTVIHDQLQIDIVGRNQVTVSGPSVLLEPETALHVAMLLNELLGNAVMHGAFSINGGRIGIDWTVEDWVLRLHWHEYLGPSVSLPVKRGFGMMLIEQSAKAHGGEAILSCGVHGLVWDITLALPRTGEISQSFRPDQSRGRNKREERSEPMDALTGKRVLVVEDEPLIALEHAASLEDLGITPVGPAGTVEEALRLVNSLPLDAALLDGNLSGHPVDEVAAALTRRRVPFVFVTGYGRASLPQAFQNAPVIAKPCTLDVLMTMMERLFTSNVGGAIPLRGKPSR